VNGALFRQDPAFSSWRMFLLSVVLATNIVLGMTFVVGFVTRGGHVQPEIAGPSLLLVAWLGAVFYLLTPLARTRCRRLALSLPLSTRRLWLFHAGATFLGALSFPALSLVVLALLRPYFPPAARAALPDGGTLLVMGALTAAVLALAVVLLQALRPAERRVPLDGRFLASALPLLLVALPALLLLAVRAPWTALLPAALALGLGWWIHGRVPAVWLAAPAEPSDGRARPATAGPVRVAGGRRLLARAVWGLLYGKRAALLYLIYPMVLVLGFLLSGYLGQNVTGDEFRIPMVFMTAYVMTSTLGLAMRGIHPLDPLPVSRRAIFAAIVLPHMLVAGLGYAAGTVAAALSAEPRQRINWGEAEDRWGLLVPVKYLEVAWDGAPPDIVAPWGERVAPRTWPLASRGEAVIWKPYTTTPASSPEFVAWQLGRAVKTIYGADIDPEELRVRYLVTDENGAAHVAAGGLTLEWDYPDLAPQGGGRDFPVLFLGVGLAYLAAIAIYAGAFRSRVSDRARKVTLVVVMVLLLLGYMAPFLLSITGVMPFWKFEAVGQGGWRHLTWDVPGGAPALWILGALALAAAYLAVERIFRCVEAPANRGPKELGLFGALSRD